MAFKQVHQMLTTKGYKPIFNVTDNQAAAPIKAYMQENNGTVQLVEPNNHQVNAAERAIQTFKNHFISGLCTTDPNFPFQMEPSHRPSNHHMQHPTMLPH